MNATKPAGTGCNSAPEPVPAAHPLLLLLDELTQSRPELTWMDWAACPETDPEAFFVEKGGSVRPAKLICSRCIVRDECAEYALQHDLHGVWGGLSERQRREMRASRKAAA